MYIKNCGWQLEYIYERRDIDSVCARDEEGKWRGEGGGGKVGWSGASNKNILHGENVEA